MDTYETGSSQNNPQCAPSGSLIPLLGGAGLGALLMYLFDPEEGQARREQMAHLAEDAYHKGSEALGSTWETLRDKGSEYGKASYKAMSNLGSSLSDQASDLGGRVRSSRLGRRVGDGVGNFNDEASKRLRYLLHGNENHGLEHGWSQALAAVGCIALGFGAMYLMDPADGARRRATMSNKFLSMFGRLGRSIDGLGRDLFNRASGTLHEARAGLSREQVSDHVLEDRIRAAIGHAVSSARNVQVEADNGSVTLTGNIATSEVDGLLKTIWGVRGVTELINRLNIGGTYGNANPFEGSPASATGQSQPSAGSPGDGCGCGCSDTTANLPREGSTSNASMGATPPNPTQM